MKIRYFKALKSVAPFACDVLYYHYNNGGLFFVDTDKNFTKWRSHGCLSLMEAYVKKGWAREIPEEEIVLMGFELWI